MTDFPDMRGGAAAGFFVPSDARTLRYAVALSLVALALGLTLALQHFESGRPTLFLFFAAIVAAAWFGGVGPGGLAAAASVPAGLYFYSGALHATHLTLDNYVLFFFFTVCAMAGGFLSSRQRDADARLMRTHRALEIQAAELTAANAALTEEMAERRRAEQALGETQAQLAHAGRLTALGELTASIAHEINQPLGAVATNASCCLRWLEPDKLDLGEAREAALSVVQDANRASEVIKRIRAMASRTAAAHAQVDLNALITDVLALLDRELKRHAIGVETRLAAGLPAVTGDRVELQQVVLNLILNAIEAMTAGGGRSRTLTLATQASGGGVLLTVADNGVGFAGRDPDSIFDAFVTSKDEGMGLGLSICRSIVEAHGGHIGAAARVPHGAVFEITLPVEDGHD
jgi:C4-dicarboxylate-specific signal transduction histidine kinase